MGCKYLTLKDVPVLTELVGRLEEETSRVMRGLENNECCTYRDLTTGMLKVLKQIANKDEISHWVDKRNRKLIRSSAL